MIPKGNSFGTIKWSNPRFNRYSGTGEWDCWSPVLEQIAHHGSPLKTVEEEKASG